MERRIELIIVENLVAPERRAPGTEGSRRLPFCARDWICALAAVALVSLFLGIVVDSFAPKVLACGSTGISDPEIGFCKVILPHP